jgi:hypothetical protein
MAETKTAADRAADTKTELERLRAENERLRGQLAAAGAAVGVVAPVHRFFLTEGDRQELELYGVANINGRRMTTEEVRAELAKSDTQSGVEIADADPALSRAGDVAGQRAASAVPGVDFVYPSVAPGKIDPAVAGQPGINGPAAE